SVIWKWPQSRAHPVPTKKSMVHAMLSSQLMGHAPGTGGVIPTSHRSPASRMPLPQTTSQSVSVALVAPGGQQLSGIVPDWTTTGVRTQAAEQVPADTSMLPAEGGGGEAALVGDAASGLAAQRGV